MIYFIREQLPDETFTPYVKIGYTNGNWKHRLSSLQIASPRQLVIVRREDGDEVTKQIYHTIYNKDWLRGEWFLWNDSMDTDQPHDKIRSRRCAGNTAAIKREHKKVIKQEKREAFPWLAAVIGKSKAEELLHVSGKPVEDPVTNIKVSRKVQARLRKEYRKYLYQRDKYRFIKWYENDEYEGLVDNKYLNKYGLLE